MFTILYVIFTISNLLSYNSFILQFLVTILYLIMLFGKGNKKPLQFEGEYSTYRQIAFDLKMGETIILQAKDSIGAMRLENEQVIIHFENEEYSYRKKIEEDNLEEVIDKVKEYFKVKFFKNGTICHVKLIRKEEKVGN